jgi:diadenosine tetraphosphate (Ap4A) HIT family hydrolase
MDYSQYLIKSYHFWEIYIAQNQSYLGRCIIWCKRDNALDLTDASLEEQQELFTVLQDLKNVSTKLFKPDWFNYAFLGNETQHLHGHFIPRYQYPIVFLGMTFKDEQWGHNYKTDYNFTIPENSLLKIRDLYRDAFLKIKHKKIAFYSNI